MVYYDRRYTGPLEEKEDFISDESIYIPRDQRFIETLSGRQEQVIKTKGWGVKVLWKDKSTNWIPPSEIKEAK